MRKKYDCSFVCVSSSVRLVIVQFMKIMTSKMDKGEAMQFQLPSKGIKIHSYVFSVAFRTFCFLKFP